MFKKDTVDFKPYLVNLTINLCESLSKSSNSIYVNWFFNEIHPYTNFKRNLRCPIKATNFYVKNFQFDGGPLKKLPFLVGTFRIDVRFLLIEKGGLQKFVTYMGTIENYEYFVRNKY